MVRNIHAQAQGDALTESWIIIVGIKEARDEHITNLLRWKCGQDFAVADWLLCDKWEETSIALLQFVCLLLHLVDVLFVLFFVLREVVLHLRYLNC